MGEQDISVTDGNNVVMEHTGVNHVGVLLREDALIGC